MESFRHFLPSVKLTVLLAALFAALPASAQPPPGSGSYTLKLYHVNYGFYPIVEAYVRTWGTDQEPLVNLNIANIGLQVKGRNYVPETAIPGRQYSIESIERRREGFRTVIVLDCSGSMRGQPFSDALDAINRFIEAKRPVDQVAILAIRDTNTGYEVVSEFTNSPSDLYRRLTDVAADGQQTRLYDSVAAALQMCATGIRGDLTSLDHAVLSSIVVLSDGYDEGSAISRSELINRLGTMEIQIPIHSIAFTRIDRRHLLNMEAISTATFGRYFGIEDTSHLARTMEHIHRINRSDYVVTFRSYVGVDGESHNFRVGVEYPSGSGSFLFSTGTFDAIDSPAVFNPTLNAHYESLKERYPENMDAAYGNVSGAAPAGLTQETLPVDPAVVSDLPADPEPAPAPALEAEPDPAPAPASDSDGDGNGDDNGDENGNDDPDVIAMIQSNLPLIGAAVVLLLVLLVAVAWVRKGSQVSSPSTQTAPPRATADPPRATADQTRSSADVATRPSDDWSN